MTDPEFKKVLSIQSHVVHGFVGNRAATFPLQLQGWDVDALNTVQLSNHTAYKKFKGTRTSPEEISDIYSGLKELDFEYNALLTGYVPSAEGVKTVGEIGIDLKFRFPDLLWTLDPVMGDEGKLYVHEDVIPAYKNILKSGKVSLITPNQFEAELLTGIKITSKDTIIQALTILHNEYLVPNVVISSVSLPQNDHLVSIGSTVGGTNSGPGVPRIFYYTFPRLQSYFTGTGDLFAALITDRFYKHYSLNTPHHSTPTAELPLVPAVGEVLGVMQGVLLRTWQTAKAHPESMKHAELQVIQSKDILSSTEIILEAKFDLNLL